MREKENLQEEKGDEGEGEKMRKWERKVQKANNIVHGNRVTFKVRG